MRGRSLWVTRTGRTTRIDRMDDWHLINAIHYLTRVIEERRDREAGAWDSLSILSGDMATYYAEQWCDQLGREIRDLEAVHREMIFEAQRRGLDINAPLHRKVRPNLWPHQKRWT